VMTVLLFARIRDQLGTDRITVADAATVGEVRLGLMKQYPQLAGIVEKSVFAVNNEFADDDVAIPHGAEVALLPPVSGG